MRDTNPENCLPYMPDRTDGILGAFDATDVLLEIRNNLRRYELKQGVTGKWEWHPPTPIVLKTEDKIMAFCPECGETYPPNTEKCEECKDVTLEKDVFNVPTEVEELKPLVNRRGEATIINWLNSYMNRNIYFTNMPDRENDMFVYRYVNRLSHNLINYLGVNAANFGIDEPGTITFVVFTVTMNIFAALQYGVGSGARSTLEKILGETKVVKESAATGEN